MAVNEKHLQVVANQQSTLNFNKKELETIRRTVAKNANDDEFRMFMHLANTYQLDPFNKEIWFIKYTKKGQNPNEVEPSIMTSRDGYLKIADRHSEFDGLVSDVVRKNDVFKRTLDGVEHEYSSNRGTIIGAYALVYRKDRRYPIYVFAPFEEYKADTKTWRKYPSAMILKVAESMALKRAFTVSGLVSKEEMDVNQDPIDVTPENNNHSVITTPSKKRKLTKREEMTMPLVKENNPARQILFEYLEEKRPKGTKKKDFGLNDLTEHDFSILIDTLQSMQQPDMNKVIDVVADKVPEDVDEEMIDDLDDIEVPF